MASHDAPGGIFEGLIEPAEPVRREAVHPRVLQAGEPGGRCFVVAIWEDPGSPRAVHQAVMKRVEGALLAELSRPAAQIDEERPPLTSVRLLAFSEVGGLEAALRAFGLLPSDPGDPALRDALAHLRGEAQLVGREPPDRPVAAFRAPFSLEGERGRLLRAIETDLRTTTGNEVWGETPGGPFQRLARALAEHAGFTLEPTLASLRAVEPLLVGREVGPIRALPPLTFQALCDTIGVVGERNLGVRVEWAVAEPDEEGLAPPPVLRVPGRAGPVIVGIAIGLLRWCVMPLQPGERIPPLADFTVDQLTPPQGR